jgi:prepilin-type processing-associated H-X9-DG protein
LVVIAIIAILAALLLPVLAAAKKRAQGIQCVSNMKQLQLAWYMYTGDNGEKLPINLDHGSAHGYNMGETPAMGNTTVPPWPDWVAGGMSTGSSTDNTNTDLLVGPELQAYGSIGGYTKNPGVYHCPSDQSDDPKYGPRVRSCSMNSFVGVISIPPGDPNGNSEKQITSSCETYSQLSDFRHLSPSDGFVFVDERADSIDDGFFWIYPSAITGTGYYHNLPALYHNKASAFSFADGHAELHRWQDVFFFAMPNDGKNYAGKQDPYWLASHGTARK